MELRQNTKGPEKTLNERGMGEPNPVKTKKVTKLWDYGWTLEQVKYDEGDVGHNDWVWDILDEEYDVIAVLYKDGDINYTVDGDWISHKETKFKNNPKAAADWLWIKMYKPQIFPDIDGWYVKPSYVFGLEKHIYNNKKLKIAKLSSSDGELSYTGANGKLQDIPWDFADVKNAVRYVYINTQKIKADKLIRPMVKEILASDFVRLDTEEERHITKGQKFTFKDIDGFQAVGTLTPEQIAQYKGSDEWIYANLYDHNDAELGWLGTNGIITYSLRNSKKGQQHSPMKLPVNLAGVKNALQYLYFLSQKPKADKISEDLIDEQKGGNLEEWVSNNVDKLFEHYLPGVVSEVIFNSYELHEIGQYIIDSDDDNEVFIEICFGNQYPAAIKKVNADYDHFVRYAEWLASTADYDVTLLSNDDQLAITFVFK